MFEDYSPGDNIKKLFGSGDNPEVKAVVGSSDSLDVSFPEDPGPAAMGKTPVIGQFRRQKEMPVARDRIGTLLD